jgi:GT2 family glycosyltransferase
MNRVQELVRCIKSIVFQSLPPDEVIIVDASDTGKTYSKIKEEFGQDSRFKYIHTKPALTHQRNTGVRNSSGDIVFFLDDDVVLDRDFVKKIVKVFENASEKKIGGVMGNIVNLRRPIGFKANLHILIERIFLLPTSGNGRFRASGCPTFVHGAEEIKSVEFLSGGLTAYRREVFKDFRFDEGFPDPRFNADDDDFSYRVSRKYKNVYTPYAKLVHSPSFIGREKHYERARITLESRYYVVKKNFSHTPKNIFAFWWSVIGLLVQAIVAMDKESFKGLIRGVTDIRKGGLADTSETSEFLS